MPPVPAVPEPETRRTYVALVPGDRVEVEHEVKVGLKRWPTKTIGKVVRKDRRRHGLHFRRSIDDKVWSDILVLERESGELTTITIDEFTILRKVPA
jgi:hypothetical protein